jgi:LRR adjacent protein
VIYAYCIKYFGEKVKMNMKRIMGKSNKNSMRIHKKGVVTVLGAFCLVLVLGTLAHAQEGIYEFQQGVNGYEGTYDTFFQTGVPDAVHGFDETWEWDDSDADGVNYGFIRFEDIIGIEASQIPPNSVVQLAQLELVVDDEGGTADIHELLIPFDDTSDLIDFGDGVAPRSGEDYAASAIAFCPSSSNAGDVLKIDITDAIQNIVNGGTNNGWMFIPVSGGGHGVISSYGAENQPKLTVLLDNVPIAQCVRNISTKLISTGGSSDVSMDVSLAVGTSDVVIVETIPFGWTAENISDDGVSVDGKITWNLPGFSGSKTLTYSIQAGINAAAYNTFSGTVNEFFSITSDDLIQMLVPLYETGNVLAIGVWNASNTSSDLSVTADLADNNGVIYVQDSSAEGGWPQGTVFQWKTVLFAVGYGEEEPGWQNRNFVALEDNWWAIQTDLGFTIGHGGNDGENGETLLAEDDETVYTRSIFDAVNHEGIFELTLKLEGDDAALAWLNGVYIGLAGEAASDRGEVPPNFVFDTTTGTDSGGIESNPSTYTQAEARTFKILIKATPFTLSRTIPSSGFVPGQALEGIQLTTNIPDGQQSDVIITETPPPGWSASIVNQSAGTASVDADGNIVWTLTGATGSNTLTYEITPPSDASSGDWNGSGDDGSFVVIATGPNSLPAFEVVETVPLYKQGNVLAIGLWNDDNGSSDLAVTADLSDNNGVIYVQDSSAEGGWPQGSQFNWKVVLSDDLSGEEEPNWQQRDFDDSGWTQQSDVGFSIGHGGNDGENGETLLTTADETVYTRTIFDAAEYDSISSFILQLEGDDSAVAWLNGVYIGVAGGETGDNGELPQDYVFDTFVDGSGGIADNPSTYTQSQARGFFIKVNLVDTTPVYEWSLH